MLSESSLYFTTLRDFNWPMNWVCQYKKEVLSFMNYSCPWLDFEGLWHTHNRTFPIVPNNAKLRMLKLPLSWGKNMKATMLGPLDESGTNQSALSFFKTNMRRQQISNTFVSWHLLQSDAFGGSSAQLLERRKKRVSVTGEYSEKDETLHSMSGPTISSYGWIVSHNSFIKQYLNCNFNTLANRTMPSFLPPSRSCFISYIFAD